MTGSRESSVEMAAGPAAKGPARCLRATLPQRSWNPSQPSEKKHGKKQNQE
jgi:hypothetical protein